MPKRLNFRELTPVSGTFRLHSEYIGPRPRPGMHVRLECTECGDVERIIPAYQWNAIVKGTQNIGCSACRGAAASASPRAKRVGKLYSHNGVSLTLPEWADRTGMNMRAMYLRSQNRAKLPPELRQSDDYVIFGGNYDHPLRHLAARPVRAIDKVLEMLRDDVEDALKASISKIANNLIQDRIRPILLDLVRSGILPSEAEKAVTVIPEGHARAMDPNFRDSSFNPERHPHDADTVGLNATLFQYRQEVGDETAISRWDYIEDLRLQSAAGDDFASDFASTEYTRMLIEPIMAADLQALNAEREASAAIRKAEEKEERDRKFAEEREAERRRHELWEENCLPEHAPFSRHVQGVEFRLDERCRIPDGSLPVVKGMVDKKIRDGHFLARQTDLECNNPLSDADVKEHYFAFPWWDHRRRDDFAEFGFGWVCRTQYDRRVAFFCYNIGSGRLHPKASEKFMISGEATWMRTFHDLNLYMDLECFWTWKIYSMDVHENFRQLCEENPDALTRIRDAVVTASTHPGAPMRELADKIIAEWPEFGLKLSVEPETPFT